MSGQLTSVDGTEFSRLMVVSKSPAGAAIIPVATRAAARQHSATIDERGVAERTLNLRRSRRWSCGDRDLLEARHVILPQIFLTQKLTVALSHTGRRQCDSGRRCRSSVSPRSLDA